MEETCVVAWTLTCKKEDINKLECLVVSAIRRLNDCGVLIGRGESCGKGQVGWFSLIGQRGSLPFLLLIKGTKGWVGFKTFLHGYRGGKTLVRSSTSC